MEAPLVSICCLTYNHAQFIRKCLDGFLMQQTDFPIEILIHDDCSTDGTTDIIREYEAKYPELIFPLYEEENQYSRGGAGKMDLYNYSRARGKYIAYCEGDDYWTDPLKLQKQVDFMEVNPEYSVCFHNYEEYDVRTNNRQSATNTLKFTDDSNGVDISTKLYFENSNNCRPLTMLFRFSCFNFDWRERYKYYRDTHEIYHLLNEGNGRYLNFVGGVYNKHDGGVSSSISMSDSLNIVRHSFEELYLNNIHDGILFNHLRKTLLWNYKYCSRKDFIIIFITSLFKTPIVSCYVLFIILKRKFKTLIYK